jgi:hypothetical protein
MSVKLNAPVIDTLVGRAFSRALWIDVEPSFGVSGEEFAIVFRGEDKVKSGAKPSTAQDGSDRKEHVPALIWNGTDAATIGYTVATADNRDDAETTAEQLLQFYRDAAPDEQGNPAVAYSARVECLGADAKELLPVALSIFGTRPNGEMLKSDTRIGSYADHLAPKARARRKQNPKTILELAARMIRESQAKTSDVTQASAALGIDPAIYQQLMSVFAQANTLGLSAALQQM